ncbi:MAG: hypothetical protein ACREGH_01355 [Minisyncoccia bacterium]
MSEKTIVIYHADCYDGFSGAWTAWKRFGDVADYRPMKYTDVMPRDLAGARVYFIDFCYDKDTMLAYEKEALSLTLIDHHAGARDVSEAVHDHAFDDARSAATLAWSYFNPGVPVPEFLSYIEDSDLWRYALPFSKEIGAYLFMVPFDFEEWDRLSRDFEDQRIFEQLAERGSYYQEYFTRAVEKLAHFAEPVEFDGYTVLAVNGPRILRSELGYVLSKWQSPFGIVYYKAGGVWHITMRGDGVINLAEIAKRYGGNGHHNAAGFRVPDGQPFPFKTIQK